MVPCGCTIQEQCYACAREEGLLAELELYKASLRKRHEEIGRCHEFCQDHSEAKDLGRNVIEVVVDKAYELLKFKQEVMRVWGEGVNHGFGDFWDDIRDLLTDDEQRQAIEETR